MDQPDKTSTDDLKRMLRRLERIEAEKAERAQVRGRRQVGAREIATPPLAERRSSIVTTDVPDGTVQALPPELPSSSPPPVTSGIANETGSTAEIRPPHQRTSAPLIIAAIAAVMVSTATAAAVTFWLMGGLDRTALNLGFASKTADHNDSTGVSAVDPPATILPEPAIEARGSRDSVASSSDPAGTTDSADAGERTPEATETAADVTPPEKAMPAATAVEDGNVAAAEPKPEQSEPAPAIASAETADTETSDTETSVDIAASDAPVSPELDVIEEAAETAPEDAIERSTAVSSERPDASEDAGPEAADVDPAPETSVAALQSPIDAPALHASDSEPVAPGSVKLVNPERVTAEAGVPLPFPIAIESVSGRSTGYYVVVSGLTRGSSFSSGIQLLYDTWQIPARSLSDLKLNASSRFARRMKLKVELRGPQGETVARTSLIVELPGTARSEAGLEELDVSSVTAPSEAAQELIDRAEVFLDNGSLQAARMLLERAAAQGAGAAAMMLAASYDPQFADHYSADAEPARARKWYQRAAELGVTAAATRLRSM